MKTIVLFILALTIFSLASSKKMKIMKLNEKYRPVYDNSNDDDENDNGNKQYSEPKDKYEKRDSKINSKYDFPGFDEQVNEYEQNNAKKYVVDDRKEKKSENTDGNEKIQKPSQTQNKNDKVEKEKYN